jgi:hypothetical protein
MAPKRAIKKRWIGAQETIEKTVGAISTKKMPEYKAAKISVFLEEQYEDMSNLNVLSKQRYFGNLLLVLSNKNNFAHELLDIQKLVTQ